MIDGLEGVFGDPNGPAYQQREERVGPPLAYVQEKLGNALRAIHALAHASAGQAASGSTDEKRQRKTAEAFYYSLVAYLALTNMLAAADDPDLVERLTAYSVDEFEQWLDDIERGESVTG